MKQQRSTHTRQRKFRFPALLMALLLAYAITSCADPTRDQEIDITLRSEYSGLADAINDAAHTLSEKLSLIESALTGGLADTKARQELIRKAIESLSGSVADKLAAIETAVKSQTTSLEMKLSLIEVAVREGFAAGATQQELLQQAVKALDGTVEEKLAAIESAVKAQTTGLETKIGLVEAAVEEGLADSASANELLKEAIEALGGTIGEKLAAVAAAVGSQTADLSAKLGLIETAVKEGFAEAKEQQGLIQTAIDSLGGTLEEKLVALEKAVTSQTLSFETKLDLIEAGVADNIAGDVAAQELIKKAIESLNGTLEEKMAAIESAIGSQTTGLSAKLGLIETAVQEGLAGDNSQQELIESALNSLGGDLGEKLAALEKAVTSRTAGLETKLIAIETAVSNGFAAEKDQLGLIRKAVSAMNGTMEEKLAVIEKAVTRKTTGLGTKLGTIESALKKGIVDVAKAQGLIQQALTSLPGTVAEKLDEIGKAVSGQTSSLDTYLKAIEQAVKNGFTDSQGKADLIEQAVKGLGDKADEVLDKLHEAMSGPLSGLDSKLETIGSAVTNGFAGADKALGLIWEAIDAVQKSIEGTNTSIGSVTKALRGVLKAIEDTDKAIMNVADALSYILTSLDNQPDYSKLLQEIKEIIEQVIPPISIEFSDEYIENDELMMMTELSLPIEYTVTSDLDAVVTVTPSDDISATVIPDTSDPLKGTIQIVAGKSITDGKTKVEVTASNKGNSVKRTLSIMEAYLTPLEPVTQITDTIHVAFDCTTLELKYKSNMETSKPEVPDTLRNEDIPWLEVLSTDDTDETTTIQVKLLPNTGDRIRVTSVTVKETRFHKAALEFIIKQEYEDTIIEFEDQELRDKLMESGLDTNDDHEICYSEARAANSLYQLFGDNLTEGAKYSSFDEFQYFTGITTIPAGSFNSWTKLSSITLPESITTIQGGEGNEDGPFVDCPQLKAINSQFSTKDKTALIYEGKLLKVVEKINNNTYEIPEKEVKIIGSKAFYKSPLENVKFPESLKTIRDKAFEYSQISSVTFPTSGSGAEAVAVVDSIAENSFVHCFNLQEFVGPKQKGQVRVTPDNLGLYRDTTLLAFAMGTKTTAFVIPENLGIKKLAASVFSVMDKDNKIDKSAAQFTEIGLPSTVTHIGERAFSGQSSKLNIYCAGENPFRMDPDVFDNTSNVTIYVPAVIVNGSVDEDATNKRIASFKNEMDSEDRLRVKVSYYTDWPFGTPIDFKDNKLKQALIENGLDMDGDGEISTFEAKVQTTLETMLGTYLKGGAKFEYFDEFQYFTGITTIPAGSFNNWTELISITLPNSIETIDIDFKDQAEATTSPDKTIFWNCPKLSHINGKFASDDNDALIYNREGESTSKLVKVAETIGEYTVPDGVDTIARYCFYNSKAKWVHFSKSLKVIGDCAFEFSAIQKVEFPLGDGTSSASPDTDTCIVTTVYDRTFAHCYQLRAFDGARNKGKLKVCAKNRVLYCDTTAYAYAMKSSVSTTVIIPKDKGIRRLADCLFEMINPDGTLLSRDECYLETIVLPDGINTIGSRTFYNQAKLKALYFYGEEVPDRCGEQALGQVGDEMIVYVPQKANLEAFSKKLNFEYSRIDNWVIWEFQ